MKKKTFYNDVYGVDFTFIFNYTEAELATVLKKYKLQDCMDAKEYYEDANGFCCKTGENRANILLAVKAEQPTVEAITTLAHECLHAASFCLVDRGVKFDKDKQEAYTYLLSWIMKKCTQYMFDHWWNVTEEYNIRLVKTEEIEEAKARILEEAGGIL